MFPNSQEALPLPRKPNLDRYKKLAKDLVEACKSDNSEAIGNWAENWIRMLVKQSGVTLTRQLPVAIQRWVDEVEEFATRRLLHDQNGRCRLADAQLIIARSHAFESWARFARHLAGLTQKDSKVARFEAAADAIISG